MLNIANNIAINVNVPEYSVQLDSTKSSDHQKRYFSVFEVCAGPPNSRSRFKIWRVWAGKLSKILRQSCSVTLSPGKIRPKSLS